MPIDDYGRWWPTTEDEGYNNEDVAAREIPAAQQALASAEFLAWRARGGGFARRRPALRVRDEPGHNRTWLGKYPKMNVAAMQEMPVYNRGVELPPFKVDYDSHEQINQKLNQTVILLKGHPFVVAGTIALEEVGKFALLLSDRNSTMSWVNYDEVTDFRTVAPGYVNHAANAYWVYRVPDRQNHQGMTSRNTFMKPAGDGRPSGMHNATMVQCLTNRRNIPFQQNLVELIENGVISSIRLSNNLALHKIKNKGASCGIEYIGRPLGLVIDGRVKVLDEVDLGPTWIHKDCIDVNLELF